MKQKKKNCFYKIRTNALQKISPSRNSSLLCPRSLSVSKFLIFHTSGTFYFFLPVLRNYSMDFKCNWSLYLFTSQTKFIKLFSSKRSLHLSQKRVFGLTLMSWENHLKKLSKTVAVSLFNINFSYQKHFFFQKLHCPTFYCTFSSTFEWAFLVKFPIDQIIFFKLQDGVSSSILQAIMSENSGTLDRCELQTLWLC